jgi:nucleotide-binding universal stress UspA family protein
MTDAARDHAARERTVVVGADGSAPSRAAVEWAAGQAEVTGARLEALTCWQWPATFGFPVPLPSDYDPAGEAARVAEEAVAPARAAHPGLDIRTSVLEGPAARVLVDASSRAQLLVVGSRGHGAFTGVLVGSVSEHCVAHAHCPVVVVRP